MFMVEVNTPSKYTALFNLKVVKNQLATKLNLNLMLHNIISVLIK
jgi:hypothetical protein